MITRLANCLCKCNILGASVRNNRDTVESDAQNNVELDVLYRQLRHADQSNVENINDTNEYNPSILGVFQPLNPNPPAEE